MKFCRDNWEDIRKYFDKSYMKFPYIGDEVVYVESVSEQGMRGKQLNPDFDAWAFTFDANPQGTEVEFILPHKSFFEFEGCVYFLSRLPSKQYKRGICRENTSISGMNGDGFFDVGLALDLINAYTGKPSFQGFRTDKVGLSYVVAPRMAVDNVGRIFIDRIRVGYVDVKAGSINCSHNLFLPEIESVLKEHNQGAFKLLTTKTPIPRVRKQVKEPA